jgi:hypothetical protein
MKTYNVEIEATKAYPYYMQHRMDDQKLEDWEKKRGRIIERDDVALEDLKRADFHAFRDDKGILYIPSEHIKGSLINAGSFIKAKVGNSSKSMTNIVAGMFYVQPEKLPISQVFEIDKRSAVNTNIKARVITIRPKWKDWKTSFKIIVDNDTITSSTVKKLVEYAGQYVGIGSFRPQHKGAFGRFTITKFQEI